MKNSIIAAIVLAILWPGYAKARERDPCNAAYWVTERNISNPDVTLVKLYSADGRLFQQVKIEGKVIDIQKPRHKRMPDHILKKHKSRDCRSW